MLLLRKHRPTFVTRPRLRLEHGPPARPPWRRGYGYYCIKATCDVHDTHGCPIGRVVGYDRYLHIQDAVEHACRITTHNMPGASCGDARVTVMGDYRKECAGEVYFVFDGTSRRIV